MPLCCRDTVDRKLQTAVFACNVNFPRASKQEQRVPTAIDVSFNSRGRDVRAASAGGTRDMSRTCLGRVYVDAANVFATLFRDRVVQRRDLYLCRHRETREAKGPEGQTDRGTEGKRDRRAD